MGAASLMLRCRSLTFSWVTQRWLALKMPEATKRFIRAGPGSDNTPLIVLVNGNTASASEILAGALQDNGRAKLVGEKTFGKGLVQTVFPLQDGGALKLTTQKYFTPKGTDINDIGINPDYVIQNPAAGEPRSAVGKSDRTGEIADPGNNPA